MSHGGALRAVSVQLLRGFLSNINDKGLVFRVVSSPVNDRTHLPRTIVERLLALEPRFLRRGIYQCWSRSKSRRQLIDNGCKARERLKVIPALLDREGYSEAKFS